MKWWTVSLPKSSVLDIGRRCLLICCITLMREVISMNTETYYILMIVFTVIGLVITAIKRYPPMHSYSMGGISLIV